MDNAVSRRFFENSNATAWYVSAGVLAAVDWIRAEPDRGILFPEFADNAAVIERFLAWGERSAYISRPVSSLFVSEEYDDIAIANLFATGERTYEEPSQDAVATVRVAAS
jgi:hypothetical protein